MPRGLTPLPWLRRQSAQRRLQAGFGLLIALLLAVAGLAALRFNEYRGTVDAYADGSMQRIRLAAELSADTGVVSRLLISLITGDRDVRLAAYDAIESAHRRINGNVAALQELQDLARRRAMPMAAALRDYLVAYQRTVELVEAGDAEQLREYMAANTEGALAQLALLSNRLLRDEQARALTLAMAQQSQLRLDLWVLAGACLVAVLAGSALIFAIRRSITQPLQRTEDAARRMATGDYTARAQVRGHDEVAGVAAALNGLAEAVSLREAEIRRMTQTDAMTGLARRETFLAEVAQQLERQPAQLLVCLDLERLKTINALAGFEAGDAVIRAAAQRLRERYPAPTPLARLGGGGFALLLPGAEAGAPALDQGLRVALEVPLERDGQRLDLSIAIGVAVSPTHAQDAEGLLQRAEHALFEAKRLRLGMQVYNAAQDSARRQDLGLASALRQAVEHNELRVHLQPKLALQDDGSLCCVGAEALIRWQHPQRGFMPPGDFIPFAERSGRIRELTRWMLERVIELLAEPAFAGLSLAVNLSTQDLHDQHLDLTLHALLQVAGVAPERLTLELTESGLLEPGEDPVMLLQRLKDVGVKLALDDFGTGHSALAYLQRLPIDELKIDRSFVRDVHDDARREALLGTIAQLGRNLGLQVTAEGVEREEELLALRRAGCAQIQGYLTGRPMAVEAFIAWLSAHGRQTASTFAGL